MILHSDREGNDCIWKLRCHCIQILHSKIYSVKSSRPHVSPSCQFQDLRKYKISCSWCVPLDHSSLCNSLIDILTHRASGMEPSYVPCTYVPLLFITYSRVHKSSDSFFSKILKKPSIVQKKMIPHRNGLHFSMKWSKKKNSKWPT